MQDGPYTKKGTGPLPITVLVTEIHMIKGQVPFFLQSLQDGKPCNPTFQDAFETQKVCDAVINSANEKKWMSIR